MIRDSWGSRLRDAFKSMDDPVWHESAARYPLRVASDRYEPLRKIANPDERIV